MNLANAGISQVRHLVLVALFRSFNVLLIWLTYKSGLNYAEFLESLGVFLGAPCSINVQEHTGGTMTCLEPANLIYTVSDQTIDCSSKMLYSKKLADRRKVIAGYTTTLGSCEI